MSRRRRLKRDFRLFPKLGRRTGKRNTKKWPAEYRLLEGHHERYLFRQFHRWRTA